jgi:hypothetical protein
MIITDYIASLVQYAAWPNEKIALKVEVKHPSLKKESMIIWVDLEIQCTHYSRTNR